MKRKPVKIYNPEPLPKSAILNEIKDFFDKLERKHKIEVWYNVDKILKK